MPRATRCSPGPTVDEAISWPISQFSSDSSSASRSDWSIFSSKAGCARRDHHLGLVREPSASAIFNPPCLGTDAESVTTRPSERESRPLPGPPHRPEGG